MRNPHVRVRRKVRAFSIGINPFNPCIGFSLQQSFAIFRWLFQNDLTIGCFRIFFNASPRNSMFRGSVKSSKWGKAHVQWVSLLWFHTRVEFYSKNFSVANFVDGRKWFLFFLFSHNERDRERKEMLANCELLGLPIKTHKQSVPHLSLITRFNYRA